MAFITFYENEESIVQCLKLRPGSGSQTAEAVLKVPVHAKLFLHPLHWTDERTDSFPITMLRQRQLKPLARKRRKEFSRKGKG